MDSNDSTQKNQSNFNPIQPADAAQELLREVSTASLGVAQVQSQKPLYPDMPDNLTKQKASKNNRTLLKIGLTLVAILTIGILVAVRGFIKGWLIEAETDPYPTVVQPDVVQSNTSHELTIEEALENGVLGDIGSGALEAIGPYTVPAGEYGQKVYVRVKNLAPEEVTFTLHVDASPISAEYEGEVTVEPSTTSVSYVDVPIAIAGAQPDGDYTIHATLYYSEEEAASTDIHVTLLTLTTEELKVLRDFINGGNEDLPDIVMDEYADILNKIQVGT